MTTGSDFRRARFVVSYRGTAFRGAAESPGVRTVIGDLRAACEQIFGTPVDFTLAGRTDAGVHAVGQVISCDIPVTADPKDLAHRLTRMCGPDIAVRSGEWAEGDFNARFSASSRSYRYHVWNSPTGNPLLGDLTWHIPQALDLEKMNESASAVVGQHDFSSFCRAPDPAPDGSPMSLVRTVLTAHWATAEPSQLVTFDITGLAFCHQMVRSLVGTMVDIGVGRFQPHEMAEILEAKDRQQAGRVAPPQGLVLMKVGYDRTSSKDGVQ
jgi:tRNA pseudouridine38-40 synthase